MLSPDLSDSFLAAGWRKPEIYLIPHVRVSMSAFALTHPDVVQTEINLLQADLDNGQWSTKYGRFKQLNQLDVGYRFLCAKKMNQKLILEQQRSRNMFFPTPYITSQRL